MKALLQWFDSEKAPASVETSQTDRVEWLRILPFILLHLGCLLIIFVGWSWTAVGVAAGLYFLRMFGITAFYHRYFSHRTFKASRFWQFMFALLGNSSCQRGPLWWAAHHRYHHRYSDQEQDVHSPVRRGFWWAHLIWLTTGRNFPTKHSYVQDLNKYPELRWLNRFDTAVPLLLALSLFGLGEWLSARAPRLGTNGPQMLVWGFFVSTVLLLHGTCAINSLAHLIGRRRYNTRDTSRNSLLLALITLGEGWHNNHHYFAASARQGFYWWEIDITYYLLVLLSWMGIVKDLRGVPQRVREARA